MLILGIIAIIIVGLAPVIAYIYGEWKGIDIDTKTSQGKETSQAKVGDEVALSIKPEGGTSPYDVIIDWGDGGVSQATELDGESIVKRSHTYTSQGDYKVTIKCTDFLARSTIVERVLHIE